MRSAGLIVQELKNGHFAEVLQDVYVEAALAEAQRARYIQALEKFMELYGDKEVEVYSVPGRSEVCGNHTDHQHGEVLAAAISLDIIAVVAPNEEHIKILSDDYDIKAIDLNDLEKRDEEEGTSEGLIRGMVYRLRELGYQTGGFDGYMTSDVLQGSGLSSSAAFEVMVGTVLSGLYNDMKIDPVLIAQAGQFSENVYFGKPSGLMDQCACSVGSLIHIDFADIAHPVVEKIEVDFPEFKHSLCIVDVHASHADLTPDYAAITYEMKEVAHYFGKDFLREVEEEAFYDAFADLRVKLGNDRAVLRAMHFFAEGKRVEGAVEALKAKDFAGFKKMIKASGESSFKYLQNIYSNHDEKNQAVSLSLALSEMILGEHGVCRVHGGGFAGTIQAFVEDAYVDTYKNEIEKYFGAGSCHVLKVRKYGGKKVL